MSILKEIGGRKFVFAMLVIFLGFLLAATGQITFDQFRSLALWALGIFSATNAIQKIGKNKVE